MRSALRVEHLGDTDESNDEHHHETHVAEFVEVWRTGSMAYVQSDGRRRG
jgi:hypothetical protein